MKQSIERSREFLEALKKSKDKNPDCLVRPKVIMKTKAFSLLTKPTVSLWRRPGSRTK